MSKKKKARAVDWGQVPPKLPSAVCDSHAHIGMINDYIEPMSRRNVEKGFDEIQKLSYAEVIEKSDAANVKYITECACELSGILALPTVLHENPSLIGAAAIHPIESALHAGIRDIAPDGLEPKVMPWHAVSLDDALQQTFDVIKSTPKIKAVGETGLDFFRTADAGISAQIKSFEAHIQIAKELNLALQIHDREAHSEVLEVLDRVHAPERVILHSFSGDTEFAAECIKRGFYLSFSGTITFNANEHLRKALSITPLDRILCETDTPFLAPLPYRGSPNAPYMAGYIVPKMAEVLDIPLSDLCDKIGENYIRVFS
ncbi:MAG: TatD family hydrolase [Bifidobacteriaceae bacterium]|jgi:TatD DNase family protein|nr:TatD family hydrolase [Bifidobacteriaceae bacterium]